jgi:hypothetical protein
VLVSGQGAELAAVTRTGWGPRVEDPASRRVPEDVGAELSAAIASAAARTRDALTVAPGFVALGPAAPAPDSTPAAPPDLRPRITELWDLRWAADRDPVVAERVETLASRRTWSVGLAGAGAAFLLTSAMALVPKKECAYGVCSEKPIVHKDVAAVFGIGAAVSLVAAALVWPRDAAREGVGLWNRRHPDQPLEYAPPPPTPPQPADGPDALPR